MVEITASDIFWIGAMDKIEIGLIVMFLFALLLVFMAADSSSVAVFLFALLLGIFSMTAWVFIPSSKTLAAMKVLPAIVNNQRIQGVAESALELTERFLQDNLETLKSKEKSGDKKLCGIPECFHPRHRVKTRCGSYRAEVDSPL